MEGIACLAVVVFHSTQYAVTVDNDQGLRAASLDRWLAAITARMWIGVPMFFVISGYCISATADSSRAQRLWDRYLLHPSFPADLPAVLGLVRAHGHRDIPARLVVEASDPLNPPAPGDPSLVAERPGLDRQPDAHRAWLRHFFHNRHSMFIGQGWTLCYEEQFYAVVGIALMLVRRKLFLAMLAITARNSGAVPRI